MCEWGISKISGLSILRPFVNEAGERLHFPLTQSCNERQDLNFVAIVEVKLLLPFSLVDMLYIWSHVANSNQAVKLNVFSCYYNMSAQMTLFE